MRTFWILILITIIISAFQLAFFKGFEVIIILFIVDFMALWLTIELEEEGTIKSSLLAKFENLEKIFSEIIGRITSNPFMEEKLKKDKEELIKWLNYF